LSPRGCLTGCGGRICRAMTDIGLAKGQLPEGVSYRSDAPTSTSPAGPPGGALVLPDLRATAGSRGGGRAAAPVALVTHGPSHGLAPVPLRVIVADGVLVGASHR
jgi:hypothetical protein